MAAAKAPSAAVEFERIEGVSAKGKKFKAMDVWIFGTKLNILGEENWRNLAVLLKKPEAAAALAADIDAHLGLVATASTRTVVVGEKKSFE